LQSLADHQRWLASLILEPDRLDKDVGVAVRPVALDDVDLALARIRAYVGGYPARLAEALAEAYPAVRTILGEGEFRALVARYRAAVPAGVYNLNEVGVNLPSFLAADMLSTRFPFLGDLAALEWKVLAAFHSFSRERFDPAAVAGWELEDWGRARLAFQPCVALQPSEWPILDLWNLRDTPPEDRCRIDMAVEGNPQAVLVSRKELSVTCELVAPAKAILLTELLAGATLGEATDLLAETSEESPDVAGWFAEWTARGLVVDCFTN